MIKVCRCTASWQKTNSNSWVMIIVMMAILITKYNSSAIRSMARSSCAYAYVCLCDACVCCSLIVVPLSTSMFFFLLVCFCLLLSVAFYYERFGYTVCICPFYSHVDRCVHLMSWCLIVNVDFFLFISFVLRILFCSILHRNADVAWFFCLPFFTKW